MIKLNYSIVTIFATNAYTTAKRGPVKQTRELKFDGEDLLDATNKQKRWFLLNL